MKTLRVTEAGITFTRGIMRDPSAFRQRKKLDLRFGVLGHQEVQKGGPSRPPLEFSARCLRHCLFQRQRQERQLTAAFDLKGDLFLAIER